MVRRQIIRSWLLFSFYFINITHTEICPGCKSTSLISVQIYSRIEKSQLNTSTCIQFQAKVELHRKCKYAFPYLIRYSIKELGDLYQKIISRRYCELRYSIKELGDLYQKIISRCYCELTDVEEKKYMYMHKLLAQERGQSHTDRFPRLGMLSETSDKSLHNACTCKGIH